MTEALRYLLWRTARNRASKTLRQLRNPRYVLALLVGLAYLGSLAFRRRPPVLAGGGGVADTELLTSLGLALAVAWGWTFGAIGAPLVFSPAEVAYLFPAPVSRRSLLQLKLVRAQGRILWSAFILSFVVSSGRYGGTLWLRPLSVWILLTTLQLHRIAATLARTSLADHGIAGFRRRLPVVVVAAGFLGLVLAVAITGSAEVVAAVRSDPSRILPALAAALRRPVPSVLLFPFRLLARPMLQRDLLSWLGAAAPAVALLLAHYAWVVRSDAAFEEAAAEASQNRAMRIARMRAGGREPNSSASVSKPPFRLSPGGHPAMAIYWKNLTAYARRRAIRNVLAGFVVATAAVTFASMRGMGSLAPMAGAAAATWAAISVLAGPQWIRNDLRTDLPRLALLRAFPLSGAQIVAAEAAASATVLTCLQLLLVVFGFCAFLGDDSGPGVGIRVLLMVALALALPFLNYLGMLLQNGAALLFPAWVRLGPARQAGLDGLGQNMLTMVGYGLVFLVALLPPLLAALVVGWTLRPWLHDIAAAPALLAGMAAIGAESLLLIRRLGLRFERLDLPTSGMDGI